MPVANSSMQGPDWSRDSDSDQPPLLPLPLHLHLLLLILREGGSPALQSGFGPQGDSSTKNSVLIIINNSMYNVLPLCAKYMTVTISSISANDIKEHVTFNHQSPSHSHAGH